MRPDHLRNTQPAHVYEKSRSADTGAEDLKHVVEGSGYLQAARQLQLFATVPAGLVGVCWRV